MEWLRLSSLSAHSLLKPPHQRAERQCHGNVTLHRERGASWFCGRRCNLRLPRSSFSSVVVYDSQYLLVYILVPRSGFLEPPSR